MVKCVAEIEVQGTEDGTAYSAWFKGWPASRVEGMLTRSTAIGALISVHGPAVGIVVNILPRAETPKPEQVATGAVTYPGARPAVLPAGGCSCRDQSATATGYCPACGGRRPVAAAVRR